jgi:hypothetical protein
MIPDTQIEDTDILMNEILLFEGKNLHFPDCGERVPKHLMKLIQRLMSNDESLRPISRTVLREVEKMKLEYDNSHYDTSTKSEPEEVIISYNNSIFLYFRTLMRFKNEITIETAGISILFSEMILLGIYCYPFSTSVYLYSSILASSVIFLFSATFLNLSSKIQILCLLNSGIIGLWYFQSSYSFCAARIL